MRLAQSISRAAWAAYAASRTRPWRELDEFPKRRPAAQRQELARRLLAQVRHFGGREDALPEWREAARVRDPDDLWRLWPQLPIVDKKLLQTRFDAQELKARFRIPGRVDGTGGSTGEPTQFIRDPEMLRAVRAADLYTRVRMGWKPGMPLVMVWGSERDVGRNTAFSRRLGNVLAQQHVVGGFGVDDRTVHRVLELVNRLRPVAIWGYSSLLEFVAGRTIALGRQSPPGSVAAAWNGAETLLPAQASLFRQAFGITPLNRYGGRELSTMACQFDAGGPLRVLRPWLFAEVVNEQGEHVAAGETGRLLWTSTVCQGTPFLRYDIGDLATYDARGVDESGVHCLAELQGRTASLIHLPDGRRLTSLYWNHLLKDFPEVRQFQVVVGDVSRLTLLLKGAGFVPAREAQLRGALSNAMNEEAVELRWVDDIPRTAHGKLLQVVKA